MGVGQRVTGFQVSGFSEKWQAAVSEQRRRPSVNSDQSTCRNRGEERYMSIRRRVSYCLLITILLITGPAEAQQPQAKVKHIGFLSGASLISTQDRIDAFRQGLRALSYMDGTNVVIEWRFAQGDFNRLPDLAADLVQRRWMSLLSPEGSL